MRRLIVPCSVSLRYLKHKNPLVENMTVEGDLDLCFSTIEVIPNGLIVDGDLELFDTKITSLPNDLQVGHNLDLRWTKITSLPDNLKVGGTIYKDF